MGNRFFLRIHRVDNVGIFVLHLMKKNQKNNLFELKFKVIKTVTYFEDALKCLRTTKFIPLTELAQCTCHFYCWKGRTFRKMCRQHRKFRWLSLSIFQVHHLDSKFSFIMFDNLWLTRQMIIDKLYRSIANQNYRQLVVFFLF